MGRGIKVEEKICGGNDTKMLISYKKVQKGDAEVLVKIYNEAFYSDYIRFGECPGYGKTKEAMEESIGIYPKQLILCEGKPVGALSYREMSSHVYYVGCLCIIPEFQGKGIGTLAFKHILDECKDWEKIVLETPVEKEENVRFYTIKCGMKVGNVHKDGNVDVAELYLP